MIFGTLSVVMLVRHGFTDGLVAPLQSALDYYDAALQILIGWTEPWIKSAFQSAGLRFHLFGIWKHMFVLMVVCVSVAVRVLWKDLGPRRGSFAFIAGLTIAALAAAAWGAAWAALPDLRVTLPMALGFLIAPGLALFLFDFALAAMPAGLRPHERLGLATLLWNEAIVLLGRLPIAIGAGAALLFCLGYLISNRFTPGQTAISPESAQRLFAAMLFLPSVLAFAVYLMVGPYVARFLLPSSESRDIWIAARLGASPRIAASILGVFLGAFAFLAANAGLGLAGL
jgi:hypothetical protein